MVLEQLQRILEISNVQRPNKIESRRINILEVEQTHHTHNILHILLGRPDLKCLKIRWIMLTLQPNQILVIFVETAFKIMNTNSMAPGKWRARKRLTNSRQNWRNIDNLIKPVILSHCKNRCLRKELGNDRLRTLCESKINQKPWSSWFIKVIKSIATPWQSRTIFKGRRASTALRGELWTLKERYQTS